MSNSTQTEPAWLKLFRKHGLPEELLQVQSVQIDPASRKLSVSLKSDKPVLEALRLQARRAFDSEFPGCLVELIIRAPETPAPVGAKRPAAQSARSPKAAPKAIPKADILLGTAFDAAPSPMDTLTELSGRVTIEGELISKRETETRNSGKLVLTFTLSDYSDTLPVKLMLDAKAGKKLSGALEPGKWFKVRGECVLDDYTQALVIKPKDIIRVKRAQREDMADEKRVELHLHTQLSAKDGLVDVKKAVATAARFGHGALAITDHGVVQAFPAAYDAGQKHGVKIIFGLEGYLLPGQNEQEKPKTYHIILLVKNSTGLMNLYKLVSASHIDHFYRHPRIPRYLLEKHSEGLIIGTACESGELYQALMDGATDEELLNIAGHYDFVEIQPRGNNAFLVRSGKVQSEEWLLKINERLLKIADLAQKPCVATGDVHFLEPKDAKFRAVIMTTMGYTDAEMQAPLYFKTTDEMLEEFAYLGGRAKEVVIDNPRRIADMCESLRPFPKDTCLPKIEGAEDALERSALEAAHARYGGAPHPIVQARLDKELHALNTYGFSVLYYIAQQLVQQSLSDGYLVGSRGSVGSSFIATMAGITEVNPLPAHYVCPKCKFTDFDVNTEKSACGIDLPDRDCPECGERLQKDGFDIPFETFLGFKGDKVPDIDLNFSGEYQPVAHKFAEKLFGEGHVFRAGTISAIQEKTAFGYVKKYFEKTGKSARQAEMDRLKFGCSGVKQTTGQHPGGMVVVPKEMDIHQFTPIQYPADDKSGGVVTTHFDFDSLHDVLVKLDILGHDDPTMLRALQDMTGVDPKTIPLDDPETMSIFSRVDALGITEKQLKCPVGSMGIPEFGTPFVRRMLQDTLPTTMEELVRISGLSHGTDVWLGNAQELIASKTAKLPECICTRDDIMNALIRYELDPLMAFKIMENVRKGKGLTPDMESAMAEKDVPKWFVDSCKKIKYMFPRAHAAAYVMMAFRIAWFKVHMPAAYYCAYYSVRADAFDYFEAIGDAETIRRRIAELDKKGKEATSKEKSLITILEVVMEMKLRGIGLLPLSLEHSQADKFTIEGDALRPSFSTVPGLGVEAAKKLAAAREKGEFISIEDLTSRARITKTVVERLREAGCLEGLPESDQLSLFSL